MSEQPLVESYWRLAWQWWADDKTPHGEDCGCLPCSDLRANLGMEPLPIRIGSFRTPALPIEPEPLMKRRTG